MLEAAFWGLMTAGSLWVGAALAVTRPGPRWIGLAMAFGSGALIAAVAYELVEDAFATDLELASLGFAAGALAFYVGNWAIDRRGGHGRKSMTGESQLAGSASAIVLGTVLDGIPESFVLGASSCAGRSRPHCCRRRRVRLERARVAVGDDRLVRGRLASRQGVCDVEHRRRRLGDRGGRGLGTAGHDGQTGGAFAATFAAGALLVMLADTLMPEAFELGGREVGLVTALGFAVGFALS